MDALTSVLKIRVVHETARRVGGDSGLGSRRGCTVLACSSSAAHFTTSSAVHVVDTKLPPVSISRGCNEVHERVSYVWIKNRWVPYPFQNNLYSQAVLLSRI